MKNMKIEITLEKYEYARKEMGFTQDETYEMMAITNNKTVDEVREMIADEAYWDSGDAQAVYEMEMASENAWLTHAESDMESWDEMERENLRDIQSGGF